MTIEAFFLITASATSIVWWMPQLFRVMKSGGKDVSSATWTLSALNTALWSVWAITVGQPVVAVVEGVQAAGAALVALRAGATLGLAAGAGATMGVLFLASNWGPLAAISAVVTAALVRIPQLRALVRLKDFEAMGSVSSFAWAMSMGTNLLWIAWAVASNHPAMIFGAGAAALTSALVMFASLRANRMHK